MPRAARVVLPGYPHHVVHRGHNRATLFADAEDHDFYLRTLEEWKAKLGCKVYAQCLMTNHVHIVIDPGEEAENLGRLMKRLAGRYTRYVNRLRQRSGTAWNGRYNSSPIETDEYFMACCRYVELNPVRAGIVSSPEQYPWSSYLHRAGFSNCHWLDEHALHAALGETRAERRARYREWMRASIPEDEWETIRTAVQRGQLTGGKAFQAIVEKHVDRRVERRGPGRPRSQAGTDLFS